MSETTKHRGDIGHAPVVIGQSEGSSSDPALDHIRDALRGLRYGNVSIVVQDGVVVQIERTEKRRLR
jgi:hypothetical protein